MVRRQTPDARTVVPGQTVTYHQAEPVDVKPAVRLKAKPEALAARGVPVVRCDSTPPAITDPASIERHERAVRAHERLCVALTAVDAACRELTAAVGSSHVSVRATLEAARPLARAKLLASQLTDTTRRAIR